MLAHVAASVVSTNVGPMKHLSVAPDGLSSSTFCESGTFRGSLSMFDSHLSMRRNDCCAIPGGGTMLKNNAFHVQISWFA